MKARKNLITFCYILVAITIFVVSWVKLNEIPEVTTTNEASTESYKYYITMPELDIRADAETEGAVDTLVAGDEVYDPVKKGTYTEFKYKKDGEERSGATWTGGISQGIRIHLLKDEFIFHQPYQNREMFGSIVTWREPTDPDLLILWKEGADWLYVLSLEDCRAGYMSVSASYEVVRS